MECLGDGRRTGYYCKPVDDSAAIAERASCAPDLSSAYKYVATSSSQSLRSRQGWARDVKARERDETFVALETLKYKFY